VPFRAFGRNPYLQHRDYDSQPAPPQESTHVPFLVRVPFRALGRNPYLRNASIEGPTQLDDASSGHWVVRSWEGFRLARASRYLYRPTAQDVPAAPPVESTWAPFLVRVPFRPLGRNPYTRHGAQDLSFVEPLDLPHVVRSRPYKPLGRNPYLWHRAVDESVSVPVEPPTPPTGPRGRGRTKAWSPLSEAFERSAATSLHYYFHRAHESAPVVAPTFAAFFVRVPFRPLGRSRYLYHFAQDTSAAGPAFNPGWAVNVNKVFNARRVGGGVIV